MTISPQIPGNMWSSPCSYIRDLKDPLEYRTLLTQAVNFSANHKAIFQHKMYHGFFPKQWDDILGIDRYSNEAWVTSHPTLLPVSIAWQQRLFWYATTLFCQLTTVFHCFSVISQGLERGFFHNCEGWTSRNLQGKTMLTLLHGFPLRKEVGFDLIAESTVRSSKPMAKGHTSGFCWQVFSTDTVTFTPHFHRGTRGSGRTTPTGKCGENECKMQLPKATIGLQIWFGRRYPQQSTNRKHHLAQ